MRFLRKFLESIDLEEVEQEINDNKVVITKLFWLGNPILNQNKEEVIKKSIVLLKPKLYTLIPALYYFIFYKFNKFKIRKTLRFFRINTEEKRLAYYTIYAVAGMIFNKDYYTKLWDNHQNKVDEGLQQYNAVKYLFKNKSKINFARYKQEILRTGFMSSATNEHKENFEENIDMFLFNKIINEAWFSNQLDVLSEFTTQDKIDQAIKLKSTSDEATLSLMTLVFQIQNLEDIPATAQLFLEEFLHNKVFAFDGEMGAGKTTFISALLSAMGIQELEGSPTYSLVNTYDSAMYGKVYHFDVFRLKDEREAFDIGIEEMLYNGGICFIEWPEKIANLLPDNTIWVYIRKLDDNSRTLTVEQ